MSARAEILARRNRLVAEAAEQRRALGESMEVCRSVLAVADRGIAWAEWIRARPYLVITIVTAVAVMRPKLAFAWSARLIALWRIGGVVYSVLRPGPRVPAGADGAKGA